MVALGLVRLYVPDFCCVGSHIQVDLADTVALVTVIDFSRTGICVTSSPVFAARADLTSVCIMALPVKNSHRYRGRRQQAKQTALRKNAFARNHRVERRTRRTIQLNKNLRIHRHITARGQARRGYSKRVRCYV